MSTGSSGSPPETAGTSETTDSWIASLLGAFLPGALAGTQVAGLLFFLNPQLPFDRLSILRGVAFYSSLLGGISLLLAVPVLRGRRQRLHHWVPIALTTVLAVAGLGAWTHASLLAFYLPPGINRRLLKAAIWLSLAALICFYTVLLHRLRDRSYGRRSRILFTLTALASIYVVMERREAFRPSPPPTPRPTIFQAGQRPQLCVVGIESATLDAILPLQEQGRLPFFSKMLREGSHARLSTLQPRRRAALWTTLATGKYPYRHGVVGDRVFSAPFLPGDLSLQQLPLGIGFEHWGTWDEGRPADASSSRARSLWEILSRLGVPNALVGWPQTTLPSAGVHQALTERYFESGGAARFAQPADLAERARLFRTQEEEIDPSITSRFGPVPPENVLAALSRDLWRQDLSLFLLDQTPPIEALFVVLPGLARISSDYFGGYSAVHFDGLQEDTSVQAAGLVSAYYAFLDELLAQLWERGGEPRMLVVVSTHGATGPQGWRRARRLLLRQDTVAGHLGSDGVLMLLGEGILPGSMRPAEIVDLVPTLLYGLGFPIARDLDGAVLTSAFETAFLARRPLAFLPSYEALAEQPDR